MEQEKAKTDQLSSASQREGLARMETSHIYHEVHEARDGLKRNDPRGAPLWGQS
jgi:hypothetical protein